MSDTETPILHLGLGTDERTNRNWRILDDALHRIAKGIQIADDLSVLGSLDVRDNLHVGGDATIDGSLTAATIFSQVTNVEQLLDVKGTLQAEGPVILPPRSLDGAAFVKGATIQGVWIGAATGQQAIPVSPTWLTVATATPDAAEDVGRYEIVFAQATCAVNLPNAGFSISVTYALQRGSVQQQSRTFSWVGFNTNVNGTMPLTMVRLHLVTDAVPQPWTLVATSSTLNACSNHFGQVHVLQLR